MDYLPWTCDRCKLKFCEDHRTYEAHNCTVATPKQKVPTTLTQPPKPNLFGSFTCHEKTCKIVLNTTTSPATRCVCGQLFCLKHRHPSDHACPGTPAKSTTQAALLSSGNTTMTKDVFLQKLKDWSLKRKSAEDGNRKGNLFKGLIRTNSNQTNSAVVQRGLEVARLKKEAKGDSKIAEDKRIYVNGEGPPNLSVPLTSATQVLRKPVYFSRVCSHRMSKLTVIGME